MHQSGKKDPKDRSSDFKLNHFINEKYLLDLLKNSALTLTDTKSWEDVNDVVTINKFKELSGASSFHAICFLVAS